MTQASTAPRYELLIPAGWWQVPLHPAKRREASVRALVDRQFQGVEDQPALWHQTLEELRGLAERAADDGDVLALSTHLVAGMPLAASLIVGVVNVVDAGRTDVSRLARAFADGDWDEVDIMTLRAGQAVRRRRRVKPRMDTGGADVTSTVIDYHVPVPDQVALLRMTFSSPLPSDVIETAVDFFDAIADSLTWKDARHG